MTIINIVSKNLIKPHTPTPQNLKNYKLSFTDELVPPANVRVLLFYPSTSKIKQFRSNLEESLSKTLARFYPLAGRYDTSNNVVDCSDQGAEFVEAEAFDITMCDLLNKLKADEKKNDHILLPVRVDESATTPLMSIQITDFKLCGGMVVGIRISHRIFDAPSVGAFIDTWSNANSNPGAEIVIRPSFDSAALFPSKNQGYDPDFVLSSRPENPDVVVKKFSFNREAVDSLKSKLMQNVDGSTPISRVRAVTALVSKAIVGLDRAKNGKSQRGLIVQAVNMRARTVPPLPKHSCGNYSIMSCTDATDEATDHDVGLIKEFVNLQRDAIEKTLADCAKMLTLSEDGRNPFVDAWENFMEKAKGGDVKVLMFSDWSKLGLYQVDFGWGKPVSVRIGSVVGENVALLMDDKEGGGIEAWVHLKPDDMAYFEQDEDIALFTT